MYLHDELKALGASRQEVSVLRHRGNKRLVALGIRREVSNMSQEPLHDFDMTALVGSQERSDTTVINSLEGGEKGGGGEGREGGREKEGEGERGRERGREGGREAYKQTYRESENVKENYNVS